MSMNKIFTTDINNRFLTKTDLDIDTNISNTLPTSIKMPSTTKNIFKNNGENLIFKDHSFFTSPNNHKTEKKESSSELYNLESKINSLETKLYLLEQKNESLLAKLNSHEENFDTKIKKLEKNNLEGKKNLKKTENTIAYLNKLNNDNSADIKKKISFIHSNLEKNEEYKNEQRKIDIELQKNILNTITEKIKETIKAEVDARFKADLENKILNENLFKNAENEISKIKKEIEEINSNIISKLKTLSKECSERAHNVSKYTDQQISNAVLGKTEVLDNVKKYMEQFVLKVKNNITNQNEQNKLFDERLKEAEKHFEKTKNDNFGYMLDVEKRFERKMNTLKKFFEINLKKHDNFLDSNMKNFSIAIDKNFNFLAGLIIDMRQKENETFKNFQKKSDEKFKSTVTDLEKICERVYQYENSLNVFDKQNNLLIKNIAQSLNAIKTRLDVYKVNQKILYTIENNLMQEQVTYLQKGLESTNMQLVANINKLQENSQNSTSTIMLELERHQKIIDMNHQSANKRFLYIETKNDENEVKQIMNDMLNNIENINLIDSLQNSKTSEFEINKIVQKQQNELDILNKDNIQSKQKNEELNNKLKDIENKFDTSYTNLEQNLNSIMKIQNEIKEAEISEAVSNCMNYMITNIENQLTKEQMDDFSKFDLSKMTTSLDNLNEKIKSVKSSTKSNSDEISDIKLSLKSLENSVLKNNSSNKNTDLNIKIAMNQMLNNVEFSNVYSLLKNNKGQNVEFSEDLKQKCGEIVDNKIKTELEKFKIENENLWQKAVEANEKLNKPGEIQQIIDKVPPTIMPINDSAKRLMDVDYFNGENENPKVPELDNKLKLIEGDNDKNSITDREEKIKEKNNEEINEKEKEKEEEDKNDIKEEENNNKEESKGKEEEEDENNKEKEEDEEKEKESKNDSGEKESKNESGENESKKESEEQGSKKESEEKESKNESGENESKNESEEKESKNDKEENEEEEEDEENGE